MRYKKMYKMRRDDKKGGSCKNVRIGDFLKQKIFM